ncbi:hypothetical protein DM40_5075 [Burkholderia cenocepacia]|nr:hypothetical protein DM40_5075 [Burkholderia cenocepacia]
MRVGTHAHSRRARDSARLRAGICQTYDFIVQERLRAGHLVEALPLRGPHTSVFRRVCAASPPVGRVPHVDRHAGHIGGPGLHRLQHRRTVIERPASPAPECVAEGRARSGLRAGVDALQSSAESTGTGPPSAAAGSRAMRAQAGRGPAARAAQWREALPSVPQSGWRHRHRTRAPCAQIRGRGARAREDETSHAHASVIEGRCRAMISFCPSAACRRSRGVRPPVCKRAEASR